MFDMSLSQLGQQNLIYLLPEGILTLGLMLVIVLTVVSHQKTVQENDALMQTSLVTVLLSLGALVWTHVNAPLTTAQSVAFGSLTADLLGVLVRAVLLAGAGITIAISHRFLQQNTRIISDFYVLIMGATLGGMVLTMASDLIAVFVALETMSITSFILAGYLRKNNRSAEASFKYLIYGGVGTAVFLFGLSLIYGLTGSTNFSEIGMAMAQYQGVAHPTLVVIMLMVAAALAYKLSIAPFHMWAPDVYEGAPTPVSAFLSVVSKTAAFAVTIRLLVIIFSGFAAWPLLWGILAVLSMTIGNFVALKQTNIKRLLAYSTVAHAGYMLLGLVSGTTVSVGSILFYLVTYLFMNLGAFASAIAFSNMTHTDEINAYQGLVYKRPGLALGLSLCLLSLTGIPITAGFFAKFFLFQAVAMSGPMYLWLVGIALVNSTVSLAYYINIIRLMVVKEPSDAVKAIPDAADNQALLETTLAVCVVMTLVLGIFASPVLEFSKNSIEQLAQERPTVVGLAPVSK